MVGLKSKLFRLMGTTSGGGGGLPNTLELVEYIQSYGLAYIDTGITSSDNTKIEIECAAVDITPSNQHSRMILSAGSQAPYLLLNVSPANGAPSAVFGASWCYSTATTNVYEKMKVTIEQGKLTVEQNGTSVTDTFTEQSINQGTIYLFNTSYSTSLVTSGRIYSCKIYDGNTLVRDFVPCYRKTTRELGFYDYVSQTFFSNAGVGSFRAKYFDFPTGYTQCEYIDSSLEQYFNTGIRFSSSHRIDMNMMPLSGASGTVQAYFGAYDGTNNSYLGKGNANTWRLYYAHGSGSNQKYFDMTSEAQFCTLKALCGDRTQKFYVNATNDTLSKNTYTNGTNAYMFARHNKTSSQDVAAIMAKIRVYNCGIYYSGTRIRTYEPCYRNSDSVAGMYDLNNDVFYPSATNVDFTKGADL